MTSNRWFILAVLFLARTSMGFQFQSVASVSPFLIDELAIDRPVRSSAPAGSLAFRSAPVAKARSRR